MRLMSCQLTSSVAFLDAAGNWTKFNIPPGVLEVTNDPPFTTSHIKVCLLLSGYTVMYKFKFKFKLIKNTLDTCHNKKGKVKEKKITVIYS